MNATMSGATIPSLGILESRVVLNAALVHSPGHGADRVSGLPLSSGGSRATQPLAPQSLEGAVEIPTQRFLSIQEENQKTLLEALEKKQAFTRNDFNPALQWRLQQHLLTVLEGLTSAVGPLKDMMQQLETDSTFP